MNTSEHFLFCYIHHCDILFDHEFDEYCEFPYWILFTAEVCIIHEILEIQIQTSKLFTQNASNFLTCTHNFVLFLHFARSDLGVWYCANLSICGELSHRKYL